MVVSPEKRRALSVAMCSIGSFAVFLDPSETASRLFLWPNLLFPNDQWPPLCVCVLVLLLYAQGLQQAVIELFSTVHST